MDKDLLKKIENLKIKIGKRISRKLKGFEKNSNINLKQKFLELCFCILVANTSVEKTQAVWKKIYKNFLFFSKDELKKELKELGYRFYNKRANYIVSARKFIKRIDSVIKNKKDFEIREWLVENIKGIGWKESSHFLRNLGFKNFSLLDRHVLRLLWKNKVIDKIPKTISKNRYLEIEKKLKNIAKCLNLNLAELDLYLFYLDTGKICQR